MIILLKWNKYLTEWDNVKKLEYKAEGDIYACIFDVHNREILGKFTTNPVLLLAHNVYWWL